MAYRTIPTSGGVDSGVIVTAGSNVQDLTLSSSLTGDSDGGYMIDGVLIVAGGGGNVYTLQYNGAAAETCTAVTQVVIVGVSQTFAGVTALSIATDSGALKIAFQIRMDSESGRVCTYSSVAHQPTTVLSTVVGQFTPSVEITSIRIHAQVAGGILTGSFARLAQVGWSA